MPQKGKISSDGETPSHGAKSRSSSQTGHSVDVIHGSLAIIMAPQPAPFFAPVSCIDPALVKGDRLLVFCLDQVSGASSRRERSLVPLRLTFLECCSDN